MAPIDRREAIRQYKQTPRPAGIFRVRNATDGRSLVGSSVDLPGMLNRHRFQLEHGSHPDRELQRDWQEHGAAAFAFEVLDRLEPRDDPASDPAADLRVLKEMWIEKLTAAGEWLYPQSKRGA